MRPSPTVVADTVTSLLQDPWPSDASGVDAWLTGHGIGLTEQVGPWRCWGTGIPGWGETQSCWALDGGDVVGVGWFLWPEDATGHLGGQLQALLTQRLGDPTQRCADTDPCWWEWSSGDVVVEFAPGTETDPRTQVHLVHGRHVEAGVLGECTPGEGCC